MSSLFYGNSDCIFLNEFIFFKDDFSTPNLTNSFGFIPSPENYISPGKRPLSSMSPTIIVDQEDNVKLILGASGGSKIISSVAQVIVYDLIVNPNKFRF